MTAEDEARIEDILSRTKAEFGCHGEGGAENDLCVTRIGSERTVTVTQFPSGGGEFRSRTAAMNEVLNERFRQAFGDRVIRR